LANRAGSVEVLQAAVDGRESAATIGEAVEEGALAEELVTLQGAG